MLHANQKRTAAMSCHRLAARSDWEELREASRDRDTWSSEKRAEFAFL
jgi:hypothetical protein